MMTKPSQVAQSRSRTRIRPYLESGRLQGVCLQEVESALDVITKVSGSEGFGWALGERRGRGRGCRSTRELAREVRSGLDCMSAV
jgi:hypothetical protein